MKLTVYGISNLTFVCRAWQRLFFGVCYIAAYIYDVVL